jgi:hypothetical protein
VFFGALNELLMHLEWEMHFTFGGYDFGTQINDLRMSKLWGNLFEMGWTVR